MVAAAPHEWHHPSKNDTRGESSCWEVLLMQGWLPPSGEVMGRCIIGKHPLRLSSRTGAGTVCWLQRHRLTQVTGVRLHSLQQLPSAPMSPGCIHAHHSNTGSPKGQGCIRARGPK